MVTRTVLNAAEGLLLLAGGRGWGRDRERRPRLWARATPSPAWRPLERDDRPRVSHPLEGGGLGSIPPLRDAAVGSKDRCLLRRGGLLGAALEGRRRGWLGERRRGGEPRDEEGERERWAASGHEDIPEETVPEEQEARSWWGARPAVASR